MTLDELKQSWNYNLERYKKAERLDKTNPALFEKYMDEFNKVIETLSGLMFLYTEMTGAEMPEHILHEGFDI